MLEPPIERWDFQSYFTAGEKEVRAWTIPVGATAPQAAGVIHSDFERGFIRCEVYTLPDLETYKTEKDIRAPASCGWKASLM